MDETQGAEGGSKKKSPLMLIAGVAALTLIGGGGGWFLGSMIAPATPLDEHATPAGHASTDEEGKSEGIPKISTEANGVVLLDPITTNLAYPSENWVRLEVALAFKGPAELSLAEEIHQDILAYMRTVSLQQIEGPRGFQYLRDDIQERVNMRAQGKVSSVMFRTMVIE
ncbi:flagellar basal body-associated FliL family protein [Rhizobium halophilum]|uniref:flagellar basal body-associated FliL family protein n=1 Tax=Rhizobium halophilum TaxID=2846852 RepID=UPI001EFE2FC3|nr:flagellar basal body-associated FliL family protein [Rhizobium halophilum]MCF6369548.1 flagellar basal body-associated FliL family protein [Rhizobium halophilum]